MKGYAVLEFEVRLYPKVEWMLVLGSIELTYGWGIISDTANLVSHSNVDSFSKSYQGLSYYLKNVSKHVP